MEEIFQRFSHLAIQIFQNLNNEGLAKCREGGRFWQSFIDERNYPWIRIVNIPTILPHGWTYLNLAVRNGQIDMVEKIMKNSVEFGIDLNAKDSGLGLTAFHHACAFGKVKIAELFLDNYLGLNIELNSECNIGATAFFYACVFGQTKIAEILVKNSQNIKMELNSKPSKFMSWTLTPFHFACGANYFNIVEMMISNSDFCNFDFAAKNIDKLTGFHMACYFGSKEIVEIIINNSKLFDFDLTAQDCNGDTGFQLAKKYGHSNIVDIIKADMPDIDYPLIGIVNVPTTYVNFRMDILNVFWKIVEAPAPPDEDLDLWS